MDKTEYLTTQKMVAAFMKASVPLETYLQQGGELTEADLRSVELTLMGLTTFFETWKRKYTTLKVPSDILFPAVTPSFRKSPRKPRAPRRQIARK
jgi:hypothetical protein